MSYDLKIFEVFYKDGRTKYRYQRYYSPADSKWIRHGYFKAYHPNGNIASEGNYSEDKECGTWSDFHENGILAAQGLYDKGEEVGLWRYWNSQGEEEFEKKGDTPE